jgi:hypothetical protein
MDIDDDRNSGPTRRRMLKRGAAVGAVAWVVPTVAFVSATPASAASPSAPTHDRDENPRPVQQPVAAGGGGVGTAGEGAGATAGIAETGPAAPVRPALIAASAAVVLGAGAMAAAHIGKHRGDPVTDDGNAGPALPDQ